MMGLESAKIKAKLDQSSLSGWGLYTEAAKSTIITSPRLSTSTEEIHDFAGGS